jgi:hypothetical protein
MSAVRPEGRNATQPRVTANQGCSRERPRPALAS